MDDRISWDDISGDLISWDEANLPLERAAALIVLADGLTAIGKVRTGRAAGQFSIHNFQLRAAYEVEAEGSDGGAPLVVLLRAGAFRRHAWYMRVHLAEGAPVRLELPGPIDAGWDWWRGMDEIRDRLEAQPVWQQALGSPYAVRVEEMEAALLDAAIVKAIVKQHRDR